MKNKIRPFVGLIGALLMLCAPACRLQAPVTEEHLSRELVGDVALTEDSAAVDWRSIFTDALLQRLIDTALVHNADVRTMELNMQQAQIQMRTARLAYLPTFAAAPNGGLSYANGQSLTTTYQLPLTMQWEINLAGREHYRKEVSRYTWLQMQERLQYTKVQMVAELANAYCTLVMLDEQVRISKECLAIQDSTLQTLRVMKQVGKSTELAVRQAEAMYQTTTASICDLEQERMHVEHSINLLLARCPEAVIRTAYGADAGVRTDTAQPVSLYMLAHRPDVLDAEYALRASFAQTHVARSAFFPTLSISADGSWTNNVGEIVNPAKWLLNMIGTLTQPLFMGRQIKGNFEIAKLEQEQAQIAFEQALLQAGSEVSEAMQQCRLVQQKMQSRALQVASAEQASEQARLLMRVGGADYLEVLTAQSLYLEAQLQATADWLQQQQAAIALYKAVCPTIQ